MTKKILVTGGCGFIGSHCVEHLFRKTDWDIVVIDMLSYASKGLDRLRDACLLDSHRVKVFTHNLCNTIPEFLVKEIGDVDYILHMAAETHVDNSIKDPVPFIYNNVMSTVHTLEYARKLKSLQLFFYFSTDEVYGSILEGSFKEEDRHNPTNPYSASKSAAEQICISYENTYKIPLIITNVMNAFGERQHVEKFIPKVIKYVLEGKEIGLHTNEDGTIIGSRNYIHARNIASAVLFLIHNGVIGEQYNIVGEKEMNNLDMAKFIANIMGKEIKYKLINFDESRLGHDIRYALNGDKLHKLGWSQPIHFEESLTKMIEWTLQHPEWLEE